LREKYLTRNSALSKKLAIDADYRAVREIAAATVERENARLH
jgi:hypothetical protein